MEPLARHVARLLLLVVVGVGNMAWAAEPRADDPDNPAVTADPMKLQGIFNTDLPRTERKSSLRFIFHPHFGDLTNRDYQRLPVGVRWGATEHLELSGEVESYLAHGLGGKSFGSDAGFSAVRAGTKYRWRDWLRPYFDTASGLNVSVPIGSPPGDVTDGLRHVTPYLTLAHQLERNPDVTLFVGFMRDFVTSTSVRGAFKKNEFHDDSWAVTPGFIWHRGPLHYTLELGLASSALVSSHTQTVITARPAVSWDLPKSLTFGSKGRWVFGLGLRASHGPDGTDLGVSGKFRGEFNFRRLLGLGSRKEVRPVAQGRSGL